MSDVYYPSAPSIFAGQKLPPFPKKLSLSLSSMEMLHSSSFTRLKTENIFFRIGGGGFPPRFYADTFTLLQSRLFLNSIYYIIVPPSRFSDLPTDLHIVRIRQRISR